MSSDERDSLAWVFDQAYRRLGEDDAQAVATMALDSWNAHRGEPLVIQSASATVELVYAASQYRRAGYPALALHLGLAAEACSIHWRRALEAESAVAQGIPDNVAGLDGTP